MRNKTMRAIALTVTVASLSGPAGAAARNDYRAAWAAANVPYKQALQASSLGHSGPARQALSEFRGKWTRFRDIYAAPPSPFAGDGRWTTDLSAVSGWIGQANRELAAGQSHAAHETLERVRLRWLAMRERHGVVTFGDLLTRFHEPMEKIALTAKGKTAATISTSDLDTVRQTMPDLKRLWAPISAAKASGMAPTALAARQRLILSEANAISLLERALRTDDLVGIVEAANRLKPSFAKLYMQFG